METEPILIGLHDQLLYQFIVQMTPNALFHLYFSGAEYKVAMMNLSPEHNFTALSLELENIFNWLK